MRPTSHAIVRKPAFKRTALCGIACALALGACEDRVAGTSVGTGNPTEIEVSFKNDAGVAPITGSLTVYASTQIPVEGYAPEPLLKLDVAGASKSTLKAAAFAALADSLWPKGSKNDSERFFNVVVTGEDQGAVLKGFVWRKADTSFGLRAEDEKPGAGVAKATVMGLLAPLVVFQGTVDTASFNLFANYHLFIYGTGFKSQVEKGKFSMAKVPKDKYDAFLLSLPKIDRVISGSDSTSVFSLTSPLEEGASDLTKGQLHDRVLLPDSLRIP